MGQKLCHPTQLVLVSRQLQSLCVISLELERCSASEVPCTYCGTECGETDCRQQRESDGDPSRSCPNAITRRIGLQPPAEDWFTRRDSRGVCVEKTVRIAPEGLESCGQVRQARRRPDRYSVCALNSITITFDFEPVFIVAPDNRPVRKG